MFKHFFMFLVFISVASFVGCSDRLIEKDAFAEQVSQKVYSIEMVAQLIGESVESLRQYEKEGLFSFVAEDPEEFAGYKEAHVMVIAGIVAYRKMGFDSDQIKKEILRPDADIALILSKQKESLASKIAALQGELILVENQLLGLGKAKETSLNENAQPVEVVILGDEGFEYMKTVNNSVKEKTANWSMVDDWMPFTKKNKQLVDQFKAFLDSQEPVSSPSVQSLVRTKLENDEKIQIQNKKLILQKNKLLRHKLYVDVVGISLDLGCYIADAMEYYVNGNL